MTDTETKPATPTLASTRARYPRIARMPEPRDADPGRSLAKWLAMTGLRRAFLGGDWSPDDEQAGRLAMAAALAWHRLDHAASAVKDEDDARVLRELAASTAAQIAAAMTDPQGPAEWLNTLAIRAGIDPDEVLSVVSVEYALLVAQHTDAEKAARKLDAKAADAGQKLADALEAVRHLTDLTESQARVMYAAWIDIYRGDAGSAMQLLREHIAGLPDGRAWNQSETGRQWLAKAGVPQQREPEAKPEPSRM